MIWTRSAPNTAAKPSRPFRCRPHSGAPAAATNARRGGSECGRRDAREVPAEPASERGRVGLSRELGDGLKLPRMMPFPRIISRCQIPEGRGSGAAAKPTLRPSQLAKSEVPSTLTVAFTVAPWGYMTRLACAILKDARACGGPRPPPHTCISRPESPRLRVLHLGQADRSTCGH